ncbi:uncharacterized protein LOC113509407 [Galleria mellonella]|uniref:TIMELESS-interacting protein n=1 Tax=Galleria mellonella TaxID=7137 RepID=A0A6J1W759_GALME|nr:uncharacterized protein LOC113509407 [Galleria mellonella]
MSLLEDVFLEDEAGEAQELERVIEGDEYDERPQSVSRDSDSNSEKEDEAVEDKRRVDPTKAKTKRVIKNPRFILNPARLTGPRGIQVIPEHFKDFKFKGNGHEKEDLDLVLKKLEHWAYRLYPKFEFEDCLKKIEMLGKKRPVMVHLHKIRSDQLITEETVVQRDSSDEEAPTAPEEDEFDKLLQQQIELARSTPTANSVKPMFSATKVDKRSPLTMPKAVSSPSITDEQKERMLQNRRLAEERRLARLQNTINKNDNAAIVNKEPVVVDDYSIKNTTNNSDSSDINNEPIIVENDFANEGITGADEDEPRKKKHNRSNVIDSSDDECEVVVNQSIAVDIHNDKNDTKIGTASKDNISVNKDSTAINDDIQMLDEVSNDSNIINENVDSVITKKGSNDVIISNNEIVGENDNGAIVDNENRNADVISNDKGISNCDIRLSDMQTGVVDNDTFEHREKYNMISFTEKNIISKDNTDGLVSEDLVKHINDDKVINSDEHFNDEIEKINDNETINNEHDKNEKSRNSTEGNGKNNDFDDLMDVDFTDDF